MYKIINSINIEWNKILIIINIKNSKVGDWNKYYFFLIVDKIIVDNIMYKSLIIIIIEIVRELRIVGVKVW